MIHFTIVMIKNHVKFISHTHVSNKRVIKSSCFASQCYYKRWGLVRPQLVFNSFSFSQHWNFCIPEVGNKEGYNPMARENPNMFGLFGVFVKQLFRNPEHMFGCVCQ